MTPDQETLLANLRIYLSEQIGEDVHIKNAKPLAGGASRDTWYIEIETRDTAEKLVLRRDSATEMFEGSLTRQQESALMSAAYERDVKVARVRWSSQDASVLGTPFFIMDYVEGISIGRRVIKLPELEQARQVLPQHMAQELAKIHTIDYNQRDLTFLKRPQDGRTAAEEAIQQMIEILDELGVSNPVWEWTLRWATTHMPDPNKLTFIHGDFRVGNLLVDENGLAAVIDWEFGHVGDPDEELGYLCMRDWRFGQGTKRAAGLTDRESFLTAYEEASGRTVSRESVDWWEVMGNIRWGIICMAQANRHLSGEEPSVELASLGRRSAEMQLEALRLIESFGMFD